MSGRVVGGSLGSDSPKLLRSVRQAMIQGQGIPRSDHLSEKCNLRTADGDVRSTCPTVDHHCGRERRPSGTHSPITSHPKPRKSPKEVK